MKNKWLLSILCLLFLSSCSENLLSPPGVISFHKTTISGSSSSSLNNASVSLLSVPYIRHNFELNVKEAYIYISKIEISKTGEEWSEILSDLTEIKVTDEAETIKISSPKNVKKGEYHGIRITIEPKIRFASIYNIRSSTIPVSIDITLEQMPTKLYAGGLHYYEYWGVDKPEPSQQITLTSANGLLIPFTVEGGKETFILFDILARTDGGDGRVYYGDTNNIPGWDLIIFVRATKYLY